MCTCLWASVPRRKYFQKPPGEITHWVNTAEVNVCLPTVPCFLRTSKATRCGREQRNGPSPGFSSESGQDVSIPAATEAVSQSYCCQKPLFDKKLPMLIKRMESWTTCAASTQTELAERPQQKVRRTDIWPTVLPHSYCDLLHHSLNKLILLRSFCVVLLLFLTTWWSVDLFLLRSFRNFTWR